MQNRAERRFTVIQAVALAELNGLKDPNPYGHTPRIKNDPTRPNEDYFQHVDWIVAKANSLGLYLGLLPAWGNHWHKTNAIFTPQNAEVYWNLFGGAFGHTYGHHSVWQMWTADRKPVNNPLMPWFEAINQPGAAQMRHARALLESRPFLTRIPDDEVLATHAIPTAMPGAGRYHFAATRDREGSYAMVYAPVGRSFTVRLQVISAPKVKVWWFNPRTGTAASIGILESKAEREFTPPDDGELLDWVLVLDDASKNFPPPGTRRTNLP